MEIIARAVAASLIVAIAVFGVAVATLAVIRLRVNGVNFRSVFAPERFVSFAAAATLWTFAGLFYSVTAADPTAGGARLYGAILVTGWAASIVLWFAGVRLLRRP
jgi:hypothetical protein